MSNLKKSLSISAVFLFAIVSSALAENNAAKPSLTHIMTYILNWHETDIGAAEKIGEGRTIYPLSGHVTMADGTKGKIVGQTADWNDGPTDNGFNIIDVRASVKLDDGDFFHLRYEGRMSFSEEGIKKFGTENHLVPNEEFHLLSLGHMYTESKKYADLHQAGIVLQGVDFVMPGNNIGNLTYEVYKTMP
tara:strand:- start:21 stop:590 length:570 start_codon:yes stop_codon:yes gene_type:complete